MENNILLQSLKYLPEYSTLLAAEGVLARNTWEANLSTGKALEILTLFALLHYSQKNSAVCQIDSFFLENADLFYSRNEIPYHHGAQAGHDAVYSEPSYSLEKRFLSAVMPRATFTIDDREYMVFREGCPLHLFKHIANGGEIYKDRPDLVIVEGSINLLELKNQKISLKHSNSLGDAEIVLSIKNTNLVPLYDYQKTADYDVIINSIYECSVSKTSSHVDEQLARYQTLFSEKQILPNCFFVNGKEAKSAFSTLNVDILKLPHSLFDEKAEDYFNESLSSLL